MRLVPSSASRLLPCAHRVHAGLTGPFDLLEDQCEAFRTVLARLLVIPGGLADSKVQPLLLCCAQSRYRPDADQLSRLFNRLRSRHRYAMIELPPCNAYRVQPCCRHGMIHTMDEWTHDDMSIV